MSSLIEQFLEHTAPAGSSAWGADIAIHHIRGNYREATNAAERVSQLAQAIIESSDPSDRAACAEIGERFRKDEYGTLPEVLREDMAPYRVMQWIGRATAERVVSLALHNTERHATFQTRLSHDMDTLRNSVFDGFDILTTCGVFPALAREYAETAIESYGDFTAIDTFHAAGNFQNGYCSDSTIGISNLYSRSDFYGITRSMKNTALHEVIHGSGMANAGFFAGIDTPHLLRLPEEAFVQHATEVASAPYREDGITDHRTPENINPTSRYGDSGIYRSERTFWHMMLARDTDTPVSNELLGQAYFSSREYVGRNSPRRELEQRLGVFYANRLDFLEHMDEYEARAIRERSSLVEYWIARHGQSDVTYIEDVPPEEGAVYRVAAPSAQTHAKT